MRVIVRVIFKSGDVPGPLNVTVRTPSPSMFLLTQK